MNRVIVKIAGVEYPIAGEETKEYLQSLGELVNAEVENITKSSSGINLSMATTLAAINIADKFLKSNSLKANEKTEMQENISESPNGNEIIKHMEFRLQEKDVQIEALTSKLGEAVENLAKPQDNDQVQEIMNISNEFQNRIFELQQEVELLKKQAEKEEV